MGFISESFDVSKMTFLFPITLLLLVVVCPVYSDNCPQPETINPCSCDKIYSGELSLTCNRVAISLDKLKEVLLAFDKKYSIIVHLEELKLGAVPSDFFDGFNIKQLNIVNCELESLAEEGGLPLSGLEYTLWSLDIQSSFKQGRVHTKLDLSHLQQLRHLEYFRNEIQELGNDWFTNGPYNLEKLILLQNDIQNLGDRVFAYLLNLQEVTIGGNRFGQMKRSMFPYPATHLSSLSLQDNALTILPEDFFRGMPALQYLYLKGNEFTRISQTTFYLVWEHLRDINLMGSPLECDDSSIRWIAKAKTIPVIQGKCRSPANRRGMNLADVLKTIKVY